ncbi:hypothetical protein [Sphingomonas mollis]|uniref:Glycosyltransferase RgtA/B/C/D-like domain-containing protein n=1 Tax=Sphingomonas mollis TaxID=2795726 RepID=A0ABS0XK73_9SPHN|nr:hypothetical protein [Sphingomonas sp. BT553]MBJ6120439.1 hypothetical protein [Sphingomonas sp. BT553]
MSRSSPVRLVATAPRPAWRGRSIPSSPVARFLWLLVAAIATRVALYGDPLMLSDEQFYLLVGDRMLQGAWPFVDIFDRKPVGLFLIFAGLRAIGGNGILVYQLGATLCAALTAFVATRIARRFASPSTACRWPVRHYMPWTAFAPPNASGRVGRRRCCSSGSRCRSNIRRCPWRARLDWITRDRTGRGRWRYAAASRCC